MIILKDTFNGVDLSKHRTIDTAVAAQRRHSRSVERSHGKGAYLHYAFWDAATGRPVDPEQVTEAQIRAERARY